MTLAGASTETPHLTENVGKILAGRVKTPFSGIPARHESW